MRILVVEDERKLALALREGLESEGYDVSVAHDGEDAISKVFATRVDLILLDLMLPGCDGIEVLAVIRKRGIRAAVLLLTARDAVEDRVAGLDAGADDYLSKPFAFSELLARIRALLRRGSPTELMVLSAGDIEMDLSTRRVTKAGAPVELTVREFALLEYLLRRRGLVVTREALAADVWNETDRGTSLNNVIDVHMTHLRRKIEKNSTERLIETIRGVGFRLGEPEVLRRPPLPSLARREDLRNS